jgi:hypothetical protein
MKRRQSILQAVGVSAHPEVLVQLRDALVADAEGFNVHRRQHENLRSGWEGKVRRSPQAMACRKRYVEALGRSQRLLPEESPNRGYTGSKAQQGKPGPGVNLEPKRLEGSPDEVGGEVL